MAGGAIGLVVSLVLFCGLILTGFLTFYVGVPFSYTTYVQVLLFLSVLCSLFLIITFAVFGEVKSKQDVFFLFPLLFVG
jgi:heme A synthase